MELGGIERSLIGLLDAIDYEKYEVDLFLYGHHGPLFSYINDNVNVLPEIKELAYLRESFLSKVRHGCYYSTLLRLKDAVVSPIKKGTFDRTWGKILKKCVPFNEKHYDIALGFFRPFDYILTKVNTDVKIGWIHTDYSSFEVNIDSLKKEFSGLDYIAGVSETCKEAFDLLFPEYSNKTIVIENCLSKSTITEDANEYFVDEFSRNYINLLSIGRFSEQKNFDNIPEIASIMKSKGIDFKWCIIGYGGEENLIRSKISEFGMEDTVIILGKKNNPYPYIKNCDIYIQPSRYEGKCVAVREAQLLNKPVIITNYATSKSQLTDGFDGVIVPMDNEGCAKGIVDVINNKELQIQLVENTKTVDYTNSSELQKIYNLIK